MKVIVYSMPSIRPTTDTRKNSWMNFGTAPCLAAGLITLSNCNRTARIWADEEDWIIGVSAAATKASGCPAAIAHAFEVAERLSFRDAWERGRKDKRFLRRRGGEAAPNRQTEWVCQWQKIASDDPRTDVDPPGDIHVRPTRRGYVHIPGAVHDDRWKNDIKGPYLVGSSRSVYLGRGLEYPKSLAAIFRRQYRDAGITQRTPVGSKARTPKKIEGDDAEEYVEVLLELLSEFESQPVPPYRAVRR